jgi:hypothetical protein
VIGGERPALRSRDELDTPAVQAFDDLTLFAARGCSVPLPDGKLLGVPDAAAGDRLGTRLRMKHDAAGPCFSSAANFTPDGGRIQPALASVDRQAVLRVGNSGIGPERDLPTLFERVTRVSDVGAAPGTGLGLAITETVAEDQGGSIGPRSRQCERTTMIVELPL